MTVKDIKERQQYLEKLMKRVEEVYKRLNKEQTLGHVYTDDLGAIFSLIRTEIERLDRKKINDIED